jgi:hypothetical protein
MVRRRLIRVVDVEQWVADGWVVTGSAMWLDEEFVVEIIRVA